MFRNQKPRLCRMEEEIAMNCQEIQKFVHVYVDGEFGAEEKRECEKHLQFCEECRAIVRFEERFKLALQTRMPKTKAPQPLIERVLDGIDKEPEPASSLSTWFYVVVPAAAMAAASMLIFVFWPTGESPGAEALDEGIVHHENALPMEVQGPDVQRVANWYRDKVQVPVRPPRLRQHGVVLTGGRIVNYNRLPAAYLVYRNGKRKKVSIHIFDPRRLPRNGLVRKRLGGRTVFFGKKNGHKVAVFKNNGVGYSVTADVSMDDMKKIVRTIIHRR